ncbi:unnamed protein product [Clavelina lepadiformis]|uniref:Secreted protein n=1 Tax=Clavelina lepadiformis TaxID=159417 RepID=A0ABP0GWD3_CLALP
MKAISLDIGHAALQYLLALYILTYMECLYEKGCGTLDKNVEMKPEFCFFKKITGQRQKDTPKKTKRKHEMKSHAQNSKLTIDYSPIKYSTTT